MLEVLMSEVDDRSDTPSLAERLMLTDEEAASAAKSVKKKLKEARRLKRASDLRCEQLAAERDVLAARVEQLEAAIGPVTNIKRVAAQLPDATSYSLASIGMWMEGIAAALEADPVERTQGMGGRGFGKSEADPVPEPRHPLSKRPSGAPPAYAEPPAEQPKCPTCGSDDPARVPSVEMARRKWPCPDPFHTPPRESPRHESDPADVLDDDADYQKAYCWEMHASPDTPLYDYEPAASCCGHAASYHALLAGAQALRATAAPSSPEEPTP